METILSALGISKPYTHAPFQNAEDGAEYAVWRVESAGKCMVLKKAKGSELDHYRHFLSDSRGYAPALLGSASVSGENYLLLEYVPGHDLCRATRDDLTLALDAIIAMQLQNWGIIDTTGSFEKALEGRQNRLPYLRDSQLELAYEAYLHRFKVMPRTLCHDDLLPFNVLVAQDRAVMIDWEVAGILPYPTTLARLIAHSEEQDHAFFYLKQEDRRFAIDYFYEHLAGKMGISRQQYDRDLALCLLYEYCEWVYVGTRYADSDHDRFRNYLEKARKAAAEILSKVVLP